MVQLRALIWAALHEYDANDDPVWPLTLNQVGRLLKITDLTRIFSLFLTGHAENSPTRDELGESPAEAEKSGKNNSRAKNGAGAGGEPGIELPEAAFA
jgi:hypothetical protein